MSFPRSSGILLHPTSLPGRFGIGDLGKEAYRFADFLAETGQHLWQVLPLGPTGYGNSPYQCLSVFAGNPPLISLEKLVEENYLDPADLENTPSFSEDSVEYRAVTDFKIPLLEKSYENFTRRATTTQLNDFETFRRENVSWLETYALFRALQKVHNQASWNTWEEDIRRRESQALEQWHKKLRREIVCQQYQQYQFFQQWLALKRYCHQRGISLIGDMPIFTALDSADVWAHPEMFRLNEWGQPTVVAGVPPDYFSKTGQLWGNPIYRWEVMAEDGYQWWIERFRKALALVDIIRLDHFRGFEKYWEVPASETSAIKGRWVAGPGAELFNTLKKALGELPIIAEDLGVITPEVETLRDRFGFPGMKVLQFAFSDGPEAEKSRPHHYPSNCVVYTGTHDNNTTLGWFRGEDINATTQSQAERRKETQLALKYLGSDGHEFNWDFIRLALMSVADTAIIPLQDILGLGSEARMNRPGTTAGNWSWRFTTNMLTDDIKTRLKELSLFYGRA
ncbi:MAG: 4-alpha-glucanotransferase [Chloroflexi bacterium]|nr:4-alpha-glucanotransferase [Chloroflexota bacterium]